MSLPSSLPAFSPLSSPTPAQRYTRPHNARGAPRRRRRRGRARPPRAAHAALPLQPGAAHGRHCPRGAAHTHTLGAPDPWRPDEINLPPVFAPSAALHDTAEKGRGADAFAVGAVFRAPFLSLSLSFSLSLSLSVPPPASRHLPRHAHRQPFLPAGVASGTCLYNAPTPVYAHEP